MCFYARHVVFHVPYLRATTTTCDVANRQSRVKILTAAVSCLQSAYKFNVYIAEISTISGKRTPVAGLPRLSWI